MKYKFIDLRYYNAGAGDAGGSTAVALKAVNDKLQLVTGELKDTREAYQLAKKELEDFKTEFATKQKEMTEKGATLLEVQKELEEMKAKLGKTALFGGTPQNSSHLASDVISKAIGKNAELIKKQVFNKAFETDNIEKKMVMKAVGTMSMSNVTQPSTAINGVPTFSQEIHGRGYLETHFRDLVRVIDSSTGIYCFFRSKIPTGEGSFGNTAAGVAKNQVDKDFDLINNVAEYKNGYANVHRAMLQDVPFLESWLGEELINDYLDRETFDFFSQLTAAATGSTGTGGKTVPIEKILKWISNIMQAKYRPTHIVTRPALWADLLMTKPNDYSIPGGVVMTPNGGIMIAGIPLVATATNALNDSNVIVGDFRKAAVIQVVGEAMRLEMFDKHDRAAFYNEITFRVEARVAMAQFRTDSFIFATA